MEDVLLYPSRSDQQWSLSQKKPSPNSCTRCPDVVPEIQVCRASVHEFQANAVG